MVRSQFQQVYDKVIRFYDFQYHLHKSTYKGLGNWMKAYSQCQKEYGQKLFKLSKQMNEYLPDMNIQMNGIKNSINDIIQCVSTFSQLHFNYSQRLIQVSNCLISEYNISKKIKQKHMKVLKDQFEQKLSIAIQSKNKNKIINQQSNICKSLFNHLDTYVQQQLNRTQKFKQQILIYLALTKKIQQKQLQMTSKYKVKISQQQIQVKITGIQQISELLRNKYNSYNKNQNQNNNNNNQVNNNNILSQLDKKRQQLILKNYNKIQSVQYLRQSLKQSTILKLKYNNINQFKNRITQSLLNYQTIPENYINYKQIIINHNNYTSNNNLHNNNNFSNHNKNNRGLFNKQILKQYHKYNNIIKNDYLKKISYNMLYTYYHKNKQHQIKAILFTIKGNLKLTNIQSINQSYKSIQQFIHKQLSKINQMEIDPIKNQDNKYYTLHIAIITIINQLYSISDQQFRSKDSITQNNLLQFIKNKQYSLLDKFKFKNKPHINIFSVIIQLLLSSIISVEQDQPLLIDQFNQYLQVIIKFSYQFLNVNQNIVKLLFLQLIENAIRSTKSKYLEEIHLLIENTSDNRNNHKSNIKAQSTQTQIKFEQTLVASIIVKITQGIVNFYKLGIPLINFFSILICLQNLSTQKLSAVQYFHKCLKRAGYTYIFWVDEQKKIIQPVIWQGQMRLKNLIQTLQMLQYAKLQQTHFIPTASQMTHILGVDQSVILKKMKQQFLQSLGDIIEQNIDLLVTQQGVDKQGYVLKLGVFLAQLDIASSRSIQFQRKYFKVLDLYLSNTQKQYNNLLDHSRKTQLWIMQQNSMATQNCIDFCSLLYKPFQFLLKTIKLLSQQNKTSFTNQFNQFIKNKLNTILKDQICKYINFLNDSLKQYYFQQPQIHYKPKKGDTLIILTQDQNIKTKHLFKQIVRRLYNLNFLKQQLNQIIHDFLEEDVYEDLGQSIFNLSNLSKATTKYKQYKQILSNLTDIVKTITEIQEKLIFRVSDITVFHCMRRLFYNLYFQQQKSAFQQFFSTKNDYKFSPYTFVKYQKQFEEIFSFIQKQIPSQIQKKYFQRFSSSFFKALKSQMLNSGKFKLPKPKEQVVRYLDEDGSFICTLLKQKYISPHIVQQQLERPLKRVLQTLLSSTKDLIQKFQAQTLNSNNSECRYILIILYLRTNDQKAVQFFKKFKSVVFK